MPKARANSKETDCSKLDPKSSGPLFRPPALSVPIRAWCSMGRNTWSSTLAWRTKPGTFDLGAEKSIPSRYILGWQGDLGRIWNQSNQSSLFNVFYLVADVDWWSYQQYAHALLPCFLMLFSHVCAKNTNWWSLLFCLTCACVGSCSQTWHYSPWWFCFTQMHTLSAIV